jgi:hypothetical protein
MPARKPAPETAVERIREIAYQLWIEAGRPEGAAEANWFEAERLAAGERDAPRPARKAPARRKAA